MTKQMTIEEFKQFLADENPELTEEGLTQLQIDADPADYDIEIIEGGERGDVIEFKAPTPVELKRAKLKTRKEVK